MREKTEIRKKLLVSNYTVQGSLLTVWLIIMLMQASFLMYDSITQFEVEVAHLAPEIHWVMLYLGIAAFCEIIGLFIFFTKRTWGFSLVAIGALSSVILTFFPPSSPDIFSITFSLVTLSAICFLLSMKSTSVLPYKKFAQKPSMSFSQFIGIMAITSLIIAAIMAQITFPFYHHPPKTIPIWQYTPSPLQYTPIVIPTITIHSPLSRVIISLITYNKAFATPPVGLASPSVSNTILYMRKPYYHSRIHHI